jgi:sugar phosphate isomerase/epimerase
MSTMRPSRRTFLYYSGAALTTELADMNLPSISIPQEQSAPEVPSNKGKKPLRLGLILGVEPDPDAAMAKLNSLGIPTCQVYLNNFDPAFAGKLRRSLDNASIEATALVVGGPGKESWDFYDGPLTIGLIPRETRAARIAHIKAACRLCRPLRYSRCPDSRRLHSENPNDPVYKEAIAAMREVAEYCARYRQNFRYETGQETPITLVRAMRDVGLDNQGVNFDLANLIMYGKANPVDAFDVLAPYIQGIHAKDGLWPTSPRELGAEVPIGKGRVDFPRIIQRLKEIRYQGAVTIEREISGAQQLEDVRRAADFLRQLIG